jgi:predicted lipid-binding transport protein (Tim44 family)
MKFESCLRDLFTGVFMMRKIVLFAAMVSLVGSVHAQSPAAPTADSPAQSPAASTADSVAPSASEPKAEPAPAPTIASPQAPVAQTTPAPAAKNAKPSKKRLAKHETDEHKARRIAAKYGVYW